MRRKKDWPAEATAPGDLPLVLTFLNTVDFETGTETLKSPQALATWLERQGLLPEGAQLGETDLERALMARKGLRALLGVNSGAQPDVEAVAGLDRVAAGASCRVRFADDGTARFDTGPGGLDGVLGRLFEIVAVAQLEGRWPRLKICPAKACRRAFYDGSNNRRSRWCSMRRCGNKANARAYRRRYQARYGEMPRGGRIPGQK